MPRAQVPHAHTRTACNQPVPPDLCPEDEAALVPTADMSIFIMARASTALSARSSEVDVR